MKVSIEEFLRTGKFGPVQIGMHKKDVLNILGEAGSDTDLGSTGSILLYAWYELFFDHEDCLYSIQNDNYDPEHEESYYFKNEVFEIDPWLLDGKKGQDIESVKNDLKEALFEFEDINYFGRNALKLLSGVVVDFYEEGNEDGRFALSGVRLWP